VVGGETRSQLDDCCIADEQEADCCVKPVKVDCCVKPVKVDCCLKGGGDFSTLGG
jgi:hypothetical protein